MRKAAHEGLNKAVVYKYHSIQTAEAVLLTAGVLAEPEKWDSHLRRTAASAIMSMVYDTPPTSEQDPSVKNINDFVARVTRAAMPGAHFVSFRSLQVCLPVNHTCGSKGGILPLDAVHPQQVSLMRSCVSVR